MNKLIIIVLILFSGFILNAQETFFPSKEGKVLIYKSFDKKDKLSSSMRYTIKHVNISGNNMDITYLCESIDNKEKLVYKEEITIHQIGDVLHVDMGNFVNKAVSSKKDLFRLVSKLKETIWRYR